MVLEWYQNGNACEYLEKHPSTDRKMLVGVHKAMDIPLINLPAQGP